MWAALVPLYHSTTKRPLGLRGPPDGCCLAWAALGSYATGPLYHSTTKRPLGLLGPPDGCFRQPPYEKKWAALGRHTTVPLYHSTTKSLGHPTAVFDSRHTEKLSDLAGPPGAWCGLLWADIPLCHSTALPLGGPWAYLGHQATVPPPSLPTRLPCSRPCYARSHCVSEADTRFGASYPDTEHGCAQQRHRPGHVGSTRDPCFWASAEKRPRRRRGGSS